MGLFGGDEVRVQVKEIHKWDYINLKDFRSSNCLTAFSYGWVWILALISVGVYAADTFTAVNLLAFNKGFQYVKPIIPFGITKWVFVGCILFSWALCLYEWLRAIRVMKQNSVTEDYLDPLAVVLQCMKCPDGWRRFLVFAKLTKSKKKAAWVAIFVYFQRKSAIRLLAAEGPRNVINAISIYALARAELIDTNGKSVQSDSFLGQFFKNIKTLAEQKRMEAIVLLSMSFSFVVWFISMLLLLLALIFWLFYISHHVNKETLTGYCRRKVEARLAKIVKAKTDKIWAREEAQRLKRREKEDKKLQIEIEEDVSPLGGMKRQPTLPVFGGSPPKSDAGYLTRMDSVSTLPLYQSVPGTPMDEMPSFPRQYSANTSLLGSAGPMGQSTQMSRPGTSASNRSFNSSRHVPPISTPANDPTFPQPGRGLLSGTSSASEAQRRYSPPSAASGPWRQNTQRISEDEFEMQPSNGLPAALRPAMGRRDVSSPGPDRGPMPYPAPRNFTGPTSGPPSIRSMTPAANPIPRNMTPGGPPSLRGHMRGPGSSISSQASSRRWPDEEYGRDYGRGQPGPGY